MTSCRVMVIDENAGFRKVISRLIAEHGYETFPAADGIDALRQIYHVMPDVIVSDAALPDLSGFRFLPFVRHRFPEIGVIVIKDEAKLSGHPNSEHATDIVADKVFPKNPFYLESFVKVVEEIAKGTRTRGV